MLSLLVSDNDRTDSKNFQSGVGKSTLIRRVFGVKDVVGLLLPAITMFFNISAKTFAKTHEVKLRLTGNSSQRTMDLLSSTTASELKQEKAITWIKSNVSSGIDETWGT